MSKDLKLLVRRNVRALLGIAPDDERSHVAMLIKLGIPNGHAQRIMAGETSLGLDMLQTLADALKVDPWLLLVPELDPDARPALHSPSTRWPFRKIDQNAIVELSGTPAQQVENGLLATLAALGLPSKKSARPDDEMPLFARPAAPSRKRLASGG
jgi:hypothetical protein